MWDKLAELAAKFLAKGNRVYIEGRMQTRSWTDDQDIKRFQTEIIAEDFILLDKKEKE